FDALPQTRAHETRRGLHLLFRHAPGLRCSTGRIAEGIDVRADGGFIIWWPREGLPFEDHPLCEWPDWLLKEAMRSGRPRDLGRSSVGMGYVNSSHPLRLLDVTAYRNYDEWLRLMMACHAAGIKRETWVEWCTSDPLYANEADEVERLWDNLKVDQITP